MTETKEIKMLLSVIINLHIMVSADVEKKEYIYTHAKRKEESKYTYSFD